MSSATCSALVPTVEVCDGETDEGFSIGAVCTVGQGTCQATGVTECSADGAVTECSAVAGTPADSELCNFVDDDCDGATDEGFSIGAVCTAGRGSCKATGVTECSADGAVTECTAAAGTPADAELCNSVDDDCDGETNEGFTTGTICAVGRGACKATGITECTADGTATECSAVAGTPADSEICNFIDDDCDGTTDEGFTTGTVCTAGRGACKATGVKECSADGTATECSAVAGTPAVSELCNAVDDDCDGETDEGFTTGTVCTVGQGACTASGVLECSDDGASTECSAAAGTPAASESCNYVDDDCDGATDEGFSVNTSCVAGTGACEAAGVNVCKADGSGVECSATAGTPGTEACNYVDDDCDGTTDEGYLNGGSYNTDTACGSCFTDCTVIYDKPSAYGTCRSSGGSPTCVMGCDDTYFDLNSVPDDGCEFLLDGDAVYVSTDGGSDSDTCGLGPSGTEPGHSPCATVNQGITRAGELGRSKVLVADGLYEESVALVSGRSLHGGYRSDTWERHVGSTLTVLRGSRIVSGAHRATLVGQGIVTATTVRGFVIEGPMVADAGGSASGGNPGDTGQAGAEGDTNF